LTTYMEWAGLATAYVAKAAKRMDANNNFILPFVICGFESRRKIHVTNELTWIMVQLFLLIERRIYFLIIVIYFVNVSFNVRPHFIAFRSYLFIHRRFYCVHKQCV